MDLLDLLFERLLSLIQAEDIRTIIGKAITMIITTMGLFGITFSEMNLKGKDFKNKSAIKYVIVDSVKDESIKSFCRKTGVFYIEVLLAVIEKLIMLVPIAIFLGVNYFHEKGKSVFSFFLIASFIIGIIIIVIDKKIIKKTSILSRLVWVMWSCIIFAWIIMKIKIEALMYFVIEFSTISIIGVAIYSLQEIGWYKDYKGEKLNCCRIIRYILLAMETVYFLVQIEYAVNQDSVVSQVIFWLVLLLAGGEYIVINRKDKNSYANIVLHMIDGEDKVTKGKVIQYYGEKIKVNLIDGTEELLNFEQIKNISYRRKNLLIKKSTSQNNVKCILKNGEVQGFSFYQLKNDKWIMFSKSENGVKDVIFIKSDDVIKVEEQKEKL